MTLAAKYNEIMDKIEVTDDMRRRILQNIAEADLDAAPLKAPAAKRVIFLARFKEYAALAACVMVLFAGVLAVPSVLDRRGSQLTAQTPSSQSAPSGSGRSHYVISASDSSESSSESEAGSSSKAQSASSISLYSPSSKAAGTSNSKSASGSSKAAAPSTPESEALLQAPAPSSASESAGVSEIEAPSFSYTPAPKLKFDILSPETWFRHDASGSDDSLVGSSEPQVNISDGVSAIKWYATPDSATLAAGSPSSSSADKSGGSAGRCSTRAELAQTVGFSVEGVSMLPFAVSSAQYEAQSENTLAQITYTGSGGTARWRKSAGAKNNSGMSAGEMQTESFTYNGCKVTLLGSDDGYTLAWWTDGQYSWSLSLSEALPRSDWEVLLTYC